QSPFIHPQLLELRRERLALPRQDADVAADGDEQAAQIEPMPRVSFDGRQDAGRFTGRANPPNRVVDRRADLGMRVVAEMPEVGGEIARADEQPVDAVDPRYRLQILK